MEFLLPMSGRLKSCLAVVLLLSFAPAPAHAGDAIGPSPAYADCKRGNPKPCFDAATGGDLQAAVVLGDAYSEGDGVPKDAAQAVKWWRVAADKGVVEAEAKVGYAYYTGVGAPQDYDEAERWLNLAADGGNPKAMIALGADAVRKAGDNLGLRFKANSWWIRAVNVYESDVLNDVAPDLDRVGYPGFPGNFADGVKWLRDLANIKGTPSADMLGVVYAVGLLVPQDYAEAAKLYSLSANNNSIEAMLKLAYSYEHGIGVSKSEDDAYFWYFLFQNKTHTVNKWSYIFMRNFESKHSKNYVEKIINKARKWEPANKL